jgi:D-glycero-D-manno-heptose 1,7-bisphosphate phosphatase
VDPAVFLDRDNTLIANDGDLGDPRKVVLRDGVPEGLRALRQAGYRLVVVTNQAGVARGAFSETDVDAVHQRIAHLVDHGARSRGLIDRFYYCPYHPEGTVREYQRDHPWRKPQPGMLLQAARDMGLDLTRSWMIGDQARDIVAGRAAGCRTVLVGSANGQAGDARPTAAVESFPDAVRVVLQQAQPSRPGPPKPRSSEPAANQPREGTGGIGEAGLTSLRRAFNELAEELRADRLRRSEFTFLRMSAVLGQLLVLLLALLGLLQLADTDAFTKWMIGAMLAQLLVIAILLLDLKS